MTCLRRAVVVASVDICSLSHNGVSRDHFKYSHEIAYIQLFILFDYTQMPITYPTTLLARDWIQWAGCLFRLTFLWV